MKLSNFAIVEEVKGDGFDGVRIKSYIAEVDVTTGSLFWKKTERKRICKKRMATYWFWADTGEFTPGNQAESLERAWEARTGREVE